MRHYGAPVRLLDWTYSFFVALFFAAEHADDDFAVWAIDARVCNNRSRKTLPEREEIQRQVKMDPYIQEKDTFCELFSREDPIKLVYRVNPYMLNRRVEVQQGLFLCPGDIRFTFQENLSALLGLHENREPWLVKIVIGKDLQADVLQQLHQMGISSSSLFPGIDGFARSYDSRLAFRDLLIPRKLRDDKHLPYRRPMYDL